MAKNKAETKEAPKGNWQLVVGALLILIGISILPQGLWEGLFPTFLGLYLILSGIEWKVLRRQKKAYCVAFAHVPSGSISELAQTLGLPEATLKNNVALMIKRGLLADAVIDGHNDRILYGAAEQSAPAASAQSVEWVSVECSGCGAMNVVAKGSSKKCDHCGIALTA